MARARLTDCVDVCRLKSGTVSYAVSAGERGLLGNENTKRALDQPTRPPCLGPCASSPKAFKLFFVCQLTAGASKAESPFPPSLVGLCTNCRQRLQNQSRAYPRTYDEAEQDCGQKSGHRELDDSRRPRPIAHDWPFAPSITKARR